MLVLERKINESVLIWDEADPNKILVVTLKKAADGSYQLGFDGPRNFKIFRHCAGLYFIIIILSCV
jgi:carbon storage regulator CsrA